MSNHHDQMSVAPDAARAEELRQRLHARLADGHRDAAVSITPADTDPDDQEGDLLMLKTEDRPTGDEPPTPTRRSPGTWLLVAAAVAVAAIVGGLLVAAGGDDDKDELNTADVTPTTAPARNAEGLPEGTTEYEPGTYYVDVDADPTTPLRVTFQVTSDGWNPWLGAFKVHKDVLTGFSATTVTNLTTDACADPDPLDPPVGPTVDDLATALTQLPPFEVAAPPTDVTVDGYSGKHLELVTPDLDTAGNSGRRRFVDCADGNLSSWISPNLGGPFWGYGAVDFISEEFWILDVEGTRLVLVKVDSPGSPDEDLAERDAMFESINIEP